MGQAKNLAVFLETYASTQKELKSVEGLKGSTSAVAECLINLGYIWVESCQKWVAKNNSNYTEEDEELVTHLKNL